VDGQLSWYEKFHAERCRRTTQIAVAGREREVFPVGKIEAGGVVDAQTAVLGKNQQPGNLRQGHVSDTDAEFDKQFENLPDLGAGDAFSTLGGKKCICDLQRPASSAPTTVLTIVLLTNRSVTDQMIPSIVTSDKSSCF
jgi:hypothetical protein